MIADLRALVLVAAGLLSPPLSAASLIEAGRLSPGDPLPQGQAALLLVLEVPANRHAAVTRLWEWHLILEDADNGTRYLIADAKQPRIHVLPPGRYFIASARNTNLDVVNRVAAKTQWFELTPGALHYAGAWTIKAIWGESAKDELAFAFPREPLAEAMTAHPALIEAGGLWLSNVGVPARRLGAR